MPGGNSGAYPGVDPDGRQPGGVEVAGRVDAAEFYQQGVPFIPGLSDTFFAARRTASQALPVTAGNQITPHPRTVMDIVHESGDWSTTLSDGALLVPEPGLYIASMVIFGTISGGNCALDVEIWCENSVNDGLSVLTTFTTDNGVNICGTSYMDTGDGFGILIGNTGPGDVSIDIRTFNLARIG